MRSDQTVILASLENLPQNETNESSIAAGQDVDRGMVSEYGVSMKRGPSAKSYKCDAGALMCGIFTA